MRHLENTGLFILSGFFFLFSENWIIFCMRLSPVPVFVLYQLFCTVKKASPGSVYRFYSGRFSDPGAVSVFPRSILCTPSGSISCSGSCMQRSLLLRHLVRRKTNSSFFLLGNLLVSPGFLSAKPHRSRRMSGTKSHETKRRQYRKNLLLEEKTGCLRKNRITKFMRPH